MEYVPELTGLRALAVFLAVSEHTEIPGLRGGWVGVDVFFVLSGYLITSILVAEWRTKGVIHLGRFYLKRALRLYPALILMLLLGAFFYRYLGDGGTVAGYGKTALLGVSYTEDLALGIFGLPYGQLGHTWSLAVEEQFYLLWAPVLLLLLKFRRQPEIWLTAFIAVSWLSLIFTTAHVTDPPNTYYRPDTRMNELFLGCLIAFLMNRYQPWMTRSRLLRRTLAPLGLGVIVFIEVYSNSHGRLLTYPQEEIGAGLAAGVLLVGLVIANPRGALNWIFRLRLIVWIGSISYGIYIYFIPVFILVNIYFYQHGWISHYYVVLSVQVVCLLAVASLSYYLVERRFLSLKKRLNAAGLRRKPAHARTGTGRHDLTAPAERPTFGSAALQSASSSLDGAATQYDWKERSVSGESPPLG